MICMKMSKTDHVDRLWAPSFFFHRNLCTLSTVDQVTLQNMKEEAEDICFDAKKEAEGEE